MELTNINKVSIILFFKKKVHYSSGLEHERVIKQGLEKTECRFSSIGNLVHYNLMWI